MKKKNAVILVCSPFQVLCAAETVKHEIKRSVKLIVLRTYCENNNRQVDKLIEHFDNLWTSVYYIKMKKKGVFGLVRCIFDLILLKLDVQKTDIIYIGDPRVKIFQVIANLLLYKEVIFLDDGLGSLTYSIFLKKLKAECKESKIKKIFFGYENISLRSVFDSEMVKDNDDYELKYEACKLSKFLTNNINFDSLPNGHYFVGQKLVDNEFLALDDYILLLERYVNKIKKEFDSDVIYISHRGESDSTISRISSLNNIKVISLELPIEVYFVFNRITPLTVASFYSTALITLSMLFKELPIQLFSLDFPFNQSKISNEDIIENIKKTYMLMDKFDIVVLNHDS